ncbi:MAG: hypothetical protein ACI9Z3_001071 [Roseivirga sp.]|jgi:hypothetical protein
MNKTTKLKFTIFGLMFTLIVGAGMFLQPQSAKAGIFGKYGKIKYITADPNVGGVQHCLYSVFARECLMSGFNQE